MSGNYVLAYDASCGPCSRFKAMVDFLDAKGRIKFASLQDADSAGVLDRIPPSQRYSSFHLIMPRLEGSRSGGDAVLPLIGLLLPGGESLSRGLEAIPGLKNSIAFGYSILSRLHGVGTCKAPVH